MTITQRLPILRWSYLTAFIAARRLTARGQFGDGREAAVGDFVLGHARPGDIDDVIDTMDWFGYHKSYLVNIGDEKGALLDAAVRRSDPRLALELGTYCGYSALRIAKAAPDARVYSVERSPENAAIARRIWAHAGVTDRVTCVVGTINDGGHTLDLLAKCGFDADELDFLFLDHDKDAYLPDLCSIVDRGWLHTGSIVVADNVKFPGSPQYRAYMREQQGIAWRTIEHKAHVEYQSMVGDLVLESEALRLPTRPGGRDVTTPAAAL